VYKINGIGLDRIIRGVAGVVLIAIGFLRTGRESTFFWAIGTVMLVTGITGACAFGSSCSVEPVKVKIKEEDEK
jgi:hypothetical protein